jgi:integrase
MIQKKFKFTEARLKALPPSERERTYYYDTNVPDLELRVTRQGSKSFYVYLWSSALNRPLRALLGKWPALTVEEARKQAPSKIAEIIKGIDPSKQKRIVREELTFGTAIQSYLKSLRLAERKETTLTLYTYLNVRFLEKWAGRKLSSISSDMVLALRLLVRDQDGSRAVLRQKTRPEKSNRTVTANRVVRLVSQVFNHSIRSGWNGKNPCSNIRPFPEQSRMKRLEDEEIGPFIRACENLTSRGDHTGDFLLICLLTGVRRRNVSSARWAEIDLEAKVWNVPETKNGLPIKVYLSEYLTSLFTRRYKSRKFSPFVFPSTGRSGHIEDPHKGLGRAVSLAGISSNLMTIHSLKHTFISAAYEAGLNPVLVSRLGGHKIPGITGRYGHASEQAVRLAYCSVNDRLLACAENHFNNRTLKA